MPSLPRFKLPEPRVSPLPALEIFLYAAALCAIAALTMYYPLAANIPLNIVLPVALLLLGFAHGPFAWIKIGTLTLGRILIVITVLGVVSGALSVTIMFWLWRLNILEALVKDAKEGRWPSALIGVVVMATSFLLEGVWVGDYFIVPSAAMIFWYAGYTIWHWNFCVLNFTRPLALFHIAVLAAPWLFVAVTQDFGPWMMMRGNSLTFAGCLHIAFEGWINKRLKYDSFEHGSAFLEHRVTQLLILAAVSLLCLAAWFAQG
jgi:hypothetical protein